MPSVFRAVSFVFPVNSSSCFILISKASALRVTSCASCPVVATIRRMPFAMPDSSVITKSLISPVRATCVPPQNSILVLRHFGFSMSCAISSTSYSSDTTRTGSGYASPKTARRPGIFWASGSERSLLNTLTFLLIQSTLIRSIRSSSESGI